MKQEPRPDTGSNQIVKKHFIGHIRPDNRRNEWSPMPSGGIVAAFVLPVALIFFFGAVFHADAGYEWLYAVLSLIGWVVVVLSASDASYIAGMRRVADQDLDIQDDPSPKRTHRDLDYGEPRDKG